MEMAMASTENCNWLYDYTIMDDILVPGGEFPVAATGFIWPPQLDQLNASTNGSVEVDLSSSGDSDNNKVVGSRKRQRSESSGGASCSNYKACREKLRRDRLNERFLELVAVMELGRLPKTDKAAILSDAVRIMTQLRSESRQMKQTIDDLQDKIKELKDEKNELRVERQRLREEKERLEQQVRIVAMSSHHHQTSTFLPPAISRASAVQGQNAGATNNNLLSFISYPSGSGSLTMWEPSNYTT
ncbi:transcription factor ILR3 [Cannabis sativa]|uniref:BHLH domain-containing protein n=1 Tax=Cannabis sativa TaxID=3483 RepID=A0A7J6HGG2_CANSA|nr:transcription factor ILR3 [Cannabis sativa]KAF4394407.1 hypothetical protein G4B88_018557 [Cannabis sativa]